MCHHRRDRRQGQDYLALGHWHAAQELEGRGRHVRYSVRGPSRSPWTRIGPCKILLVTLEERDGTRTVTVDERVVGRTSFRHQDVDAAHDRIAAALIEKLRAGADRTSCWTCG